jgi:hypothetical protein
MCNRTSAHSKTAVAKSLQKITVSVQSCGKAVPRPQKVNFSISQYYTCEYWSQRPGEVITTDFIDGFITNNFKVLSQVKHLTQKTNSPSLMALAQ